jgi:uncharacterized protein (DUF885 family)
MARSFHIKALTTALAALAAACHGAATPAKVGTAAPAQNPPREELNHVVERYWEAYLAQNPVVATAVGDHRYDDRLGKLLTPQGLADALALEKQGLEALLGVPLPAADTPARLSYELFKRQRESAIEGYTYPEELFPVNPYSGVAQEFASMGAEDGPQPFRSARDYDNWLARSAAFAQWAENAIANMRSGMRRGYLLPQSVVTDVLPQLAMLGADTPANPFYRPLERMPANIAGGEREQLTQRLSSAIKTEILPAYRSLHDFLADQYLPLAPVEGGMSRLPLGAAWYAYRVREFTEARLTPAEVHKIGLAAVERVHARLRAALSDAGFTGDAHAYLDALRRDPRYARPAVDVLADYGELLPRALAAAPGVLENPAPNPVEFRSMEPFFAATAPAADYRAATADGAFPAVLFVATANPEDFAAIDAEGLLLRNVLPGLGCQILLQRSLADLPAFRRFATEPAYARGWALYAETLGDDMGFYRDPGAKFTATLDELTAAALLVVDTGLNAEGWTRRRATDYLRGELPIDERAATLLVNRALALPAEDLSAEIGALRIRELRARAEARLGSHFDIRSFHAAILGGGALPLDLLQERVEAWIGSAAEVPASAAVR